jgi:hypothetical protein
MLRFVIIGVLTLIVTASAAGSAEDTINIAPIDVTTFTSSDSSYGNSYVLAFKLPTWVKVDNVVSAVMEFYVDVDARAIQGYSDAAPLIEVYGVDGTVVGAPDSELVHPSRALRSVLKGQRRHVRLNVTDIVRKAAMSGSTVSSVAVGSFVGDRLGKFTLRSDGFADGSVAKIHVYCNDPIDPSP